MHNNVSQQVLSKRHAKIFYKGNKVFLKDLGSTNGTYINKIRLSRPGEVFHFRNIINNRALLISGKPSKLREVYHGDILQFGSLVTRIQPIIATLSIADMDGVNYSKRQVQKKQCQILNHVFRARNSVLFTPAASQEDITVLSSEESDLDISELGEKEKNEEEEDV